MFLKTKPFFCPSNSLPRVVHPPLQWRTVYCMLHVNKRHYTAQSHCSKAHLQLQISLQQSWSVLEASSDPFSLAHCIKQSEALVNCRDIFLVNKKTQNKTRERYLKQKTPHQLGKLAIFQLQKTFHIDPFKSGFQFHLVQLSFFYLNNKICFKPLIISRCL